MEIGRIWFDFKGRINRGKYWFVTVANLFIIVAFVLIAIAAESWALGTLAGLIWLVLIVSALAVATKRLHDRDKSAWWLLVFYVLPSILQSIGNAIGDVSIVFSLSSFAIAIWAIVELGFLRGTPGPNRFGPDPLAPAQSG